ncbi:MAG: NnrU family protein [Burkholderiaceae bacterium]
MTLFLIGLAVFLGIHCVSIVAPRWRLQQVGLRGERTWKGIYSIASLVGFVLLVYGYGSARHEGPILYVPPTALRHFALLLMVPVFPLLIASSLPGRISRLAKHPMLLAVKFWALAHLLANGSLADVLLFGSFLAWAVFDRISVKRRPAVLAHPAPASPARPYNDLIVIFVGLAVYAAFLLGLHRWLIGVSPLG